MLGPVAQPWAEARRIAQPGAAEGPQTPPAMPEQVAGQTLAVRQIPAEVVAGQTPVPAVAARNEPLREALGIVRPGEPA